MNETPYSWCITKLNTITKHSQQFLILDKRQMDYKALPERWSANQSLKHIMVLNEAYFPQLKAIIDGTHKNPFIAPFSKTTGRMLINSVVPGSKKSATFEIFEPSNYKNTGPVAQAFISHIAELRSIYDAMNDTDLKKTKVHSPASKLFKFNLEDCLRMLILHTERHVIQAFEEIKKMNMS